MTITPADIRPRGYAELSQVGYTMQVELMIDDLRRLAINDGCVAAAWACDWIEQACEEIDRLKILR